MAFQEDIFPSVSPRRWHRLASGVLELSHMTLLMTNGQEAVYLQMYKDERGPQEETVVYLFTVGFLAAAISASFVGSLTGIIFAALMCTMMCGSFTHYSSLAQSRWVRNPSTLLTVTLTVASWCFIVLVLTHNEVATLCCFCVFGFCCGIYFPSIAHLKEQIVDDGIRTKIYGVMRIPLNMFVVLGLTLTKDDEHH
jgi:MFS family permease